VVSEHQGEKCLGYGRRTQQQQQLLQKQHSSSPAVLSTERPRKLGGNLLPDQFLFSSIKACSSLFDCQQLLSANKQQLDAMLLSTLVTQTVYVSVDHPEQQQEGQQQELELVLQQQRPAPAAASCSTSSSSSTVAGTSRAAAQVLSRYMRQLSDVSLQLCSSFRPQQFSNVLWGLAKCGYKAPSAWIGHYLAQVGLLTRYLHVDLSVYYT
jgi:hypothetical protein